MQIAGRGQAANFAYAQEMAARIRSIPSSPSQTGVLPNTPYVCITNLIFVSIREAS
jgi:hypothetical protein